MWQETGAMSSSELLVIALAVLLLFGGKRLPELLRTWGKIMGDLKRTIAQLKRDAGLDVLDDISDSENQDKKKRD